MLELIQGLQQIQGELAEAIKQLKEKDAGVKTLPQNEEENQEKPHQDSDSHNKETTFVMMSDQPYPEKYVVTTFSCFDGRKGSALVHISKFIDSMGAYAGNGDLCLREFSKSLDDRAYTWCTTLPPGSVKTWEDMVKLFCGKYFQAKEKITLVNLHTTKKVSGEDLLHYIHRLCDISLDCYANYKEAKEINRKPFEEPPPLVPCTTEEMIAILNKWVADGIVKLPEAPKKATEEDKKNPKFCHFHQYIHHSTVDCWTLQRKFHEKIQERTLELPQARNANDADMDEPAATSTAMTPTAIKTLQRNPRFRFLFNQLGLNPKAHTAATKAIMAIAAESRAHFFTAETHVSRAFLETTNVITFTDKDMDVQYPDHRRPLYLSAIINEVQVRCALVDTSSFINLIPLSTLRVTENLSKEDPRSTYGDKSFDMVPCCGFHGSLPHTTGKALAAQALARLLHIPSMCAGANCPQQEAFKPGEGILHPSCLTVNKANGPESVDAIAGASTAVDPKISTNEELEIINLNSDPNVHKPISISASLSTEERTHLVELLKEYQDVFAWQYNEMLEIDPELVAHSLNIKLGTRLVVQPMRTFHPEVEAQITQEVKKLLSTGFIKPIQHPRWLSNIVPMQKKNGQIRCCVDFRNLNKVCPKDEFPLPKMDLLIDSAADAKKTAFRAPSGNFYYTVIPFGLKNVGATYQRTMTAMFHDMMHREIEDYVDDIVVKSKTREDHFGILKKVFERCQLYKLKMNPLKCAFGVSACKFLGFLVHQRGINVDPTKASATATMKPPTTHKELKNFLRKLSYIKRFIPGLAAMTSTFSPPLKKGAPFHWSTECQQAFEKVQDIIVITLFLTPGFSRVSTRKTR
uniref:Reverse transcriptase domain-containing protein n=1 Tax=Fagus sylvatica TaxID=28930 RepID=A0A2N9EPF1_FAGSY